MSDDLRDWRQEAVFWRFLAGHGMAEISRAWDIGLEQVEDLVRAGVPPAGRRVPDAAPPPVRVTKRAKRRKASPTLPQARRSRATPTHTSDWQARALTALQGLTVPAACSELVTKLRVPDDERNAATKHLWSALQTLVKHGQVTRSGARYRLAADKAVM